MRLLLVDNLLFEGSRERPRFDLQPHLGLMSLAAVAQRFGHSVSIYDIKRDLANGLARIDKNLYDFAVGAITGYSPDVVGFTALGCNFPFVVRLAEAVKLALPKTKILLGGPHATILHRETIETFSWIDVVVRGEAEDILPRILESLSSERLQTVPGITFRGPDGSVISTANAPIIEELDELPSPAYETYPVSELGLGAIRIEAGRGCPFKCTFCSTASFFGRDYRLKSPVKLVSEMRRLNCQYGFSNFKLNHDLFTVNKKKVRAFCEEVSAENFTWECSARVDCVDNELINRMAHAGCRRIYFGVETGSRRLQKLMRKDLDLDLVEPTLEVTERLGIKTVTSFIIGYPEEQLDDYRDTLSLALDLHCRPAGLNTSQLHVLTPEPGTELMSRFGRELVFDPEPTGFNLPILTDEDRTLLERHPRLFGNYYCFPTRVPRATSRISSKLFEAFSELSRDQVRYIVSLKNGVCSFVEGFVDWHVATDPTTTAVGLDDLKRYLEFIVGSQHPAVSIVKLRAAMLAAGSIPRRTDDHKSSRRLSADTKLQASENLVILRGMHDRQDLVAAVAGEVSLPDLQSLHRVDLILVGGGSNPDESVASIEVNQEAIETLEYFRSPKTYWEYCAGLMDLPNAGYAEWRDIKRLVDFHILVPTR